MVPFSEFRVSNRRARLHYRRVQLWGLIPITFFLLMMGGDPLHKHPGITAALGIVLGAELLLAGAYHMHRDPAKNSPLGRRLVERSNEWFPFLLFSVQSTYVITVLLVLWFLTLRFGLPSSALQNAVLLSAILLVPVRRCLQERALMRESERLDIIARALRLVIALMTTLFVAISLTNLILPLYDNVPASPALVMLLVWVPALLVILLCAVLFIDRVSRKPAGP